MAHEDPAWEEPTITIESEDEPLSRASPRWVQKLGEGVAWLITGFFVDLFFMLILLTLWHLSPPAQSAGDISVVVVGLTLFSVFCSLVTHVVGVTKITTPEYGGAPGKIAADLARYTTFPAYGLSLISLIMFLGMSYATVWLGLILHTISIILINIATPATIYHARSLARRDRAHTLASQTTVVLWVTAYTLMIVSACHLAQVWRIIASAPVVYTSDSFDRLLALVRNIGLVILAVCSIGWVALLFGYYKQFAEARNVGVYLETQAKRARQTPDPETSSIHR